ncbi:mechanosensitive ion channel protein [Sulfurimicrobium lacus]|uniref:Mechanosensitive ion channel protein n=1 Tax=Sulfurimicrobium lacus TaxID=2715678 RepID=A0A6F8VFU5_9PROT|nr:mechanosensitive ion channel domain-containing protein [Sulfurimicrobium lacus]BCB27822.1 mechanosensitive ion channel protein [Sulfurimicrobium lacus]
MNNTQEIRNLLFDLFSDLQQADIWWQLGVLVFSLVLAWLFMRLIRAQVPVQEGAWKLGMGGVNRITFPLAALLLVLSGKAVLQHWQHVALLNVTVPLLLSLALVRLAVYALRHIFAPSGWLQTSERFIAILIWSGVALHITGFLPEILQAMDDLSFHVGKNKISLLLILSGLLSVAVTMLVALWIASSMEGRLMRAEHLNMSLRVVLAKFLRAVLVLIGMLVALPLAGIDITVLSVFGGALGVGIGFGLQKIASNYVSGFIILLDHSIRIGDLVTVDNRYGTVTKITSRYAVIKGSDGTEALIPNETLITSTVLNHSYTNHELRVFIPLQVSYDSPLEKAMEIMMEEAGKHARVMQEPPPQVFLKNFGDSGIDLELSAWINDPEEGQQNLRSEINLGIWRRFQQEGIEIPYPQRVVRLVS